MAYVAPDIKDMVVQYPDRFLVGGTQTTIVPSPGTVSEPGTPIGRALLQPLVDAVEALDAKTPDYVKLLDINAGSGSAQVNIDLSGYSEYSGFKVVFQRLRVGGIFKFRFNDDASAVYNYRMDSSSDATTAGTEVSTYHEYDYGPYTYRGTLEILSRTIDPVSGATYQTLLGRNNNAWSRNAIMHILGYYKPNSGATVTSLQLMSTNGNFVDNVKATLYGVK